MGALVLACLLGAGQAWGQTENARPAPPADTAPDVSPDAAPDASPDPAPDPRGGTPSDGFDPGPLPTLGAVVPGVLVHGMGHRIAGDRRTSRRLLVLEGIGLGAMVVAGVPLALTGASRRLSLPTIPVLMSGGGLFLLSWGADIYGAAGGPRIAGVPQRRLPGLETRLGYLFVHDPQFAYTHFADLDARLRRGSWRATGTAQLALDDDNQRLRAALAYRFLGPRAGAAKDTPLARDGSYLDLQMALTWHHYGTEAFTSTTVEAFVDGRYDLARLSPTLRGAFAEMGLGLGVEVIDFSVSGADAADQLLGRFGFGMYLGVPTGVHGEVRMVYDHRRDGLAGGLALPGGSGGFLGSVGVHGLVMIDDTWGVDMGAQAGAAYLLGASLVYKR